MAQTEKETRSLTEQGVLLLVARLIGFALSFVLPFVLVRYLNQSEFGEYKQVFLVVATAVGILPLGFSMSAYYFLPREKERQRYVIFNILFFNFIVGGLACLLLQLFPQLLGLIFRSDGMTVLAPSIGIVIWFWIFSAFLETVAVANQEPRMALTFIVFAQLTKTVLLLLAAVLGGTAQALIYAAMAQAILQTTILMFYLNSRFAGFWHSFDSAFFKNQLIYALPFGMSALFWTLQLDLHSYFVGYRFSDAEYAIYAVGCFELPLIGMLSEAVTSVLIPRMSEWQSQNRQREMIELTTRAMKKLAFVYFPLYIFLFITSTDFITTLFTDNYAASVPIFQINITLLPFMILVTDPIVRAYQSLGRYLMKLRILTFIFLVTALWFGIQYLDMAGMITIVVIISIVERFFLTMKVAKTVGFNQNDFSLLRNVVKLALAAVISGAVLFVFYWLFGETVKTFLVSETNWLLNIYTNQKVSAFIGKASFLAICFLVFAPVYLLLVFLLDTLEKEEKQWFLNLLNFQRFFEKPNRLTEVKTPVPNVSLDTEENLKMFQTKVNENLIYDVGLNQGEDTEFYLKKGFKVIAFEANPDSAEFCRKKFSDAIARGDLIIVEGAIVEPQNQLNGHGIIKFYRNVDHRLWGSASEDFALRSEVLGTTNEVIEVKATDFTECLKKYGIPYYLKADITGSETACLRALLNFENKPRYLSIRSEKVIFRRLEEEIDILEKLGYHQFKAIQQDVSNLKVPAISKEGLSVPHVFPEGSSGLFGRDLAGNWKDKEAILKQYRRIFVFYWLFGDYSYLRQTHNGNRLINKMERVFHQPLPGWYDTHAKHSSIS